MVARLVAMVSDYEQLSDRLRRLRKVRGMSRADLSEEMRRLGQRTEVRDIRHYEEQFYEPRLRTFAALARALGVSMETLFYGEEEAERLAWERERG